MEISVIYEDADVVAVNKPAGLLVHAVGTHDPQPTLADWLRKRYPEMAEVGDEPILRPGLVHRLDKETSGIIVAARTQEAFDFLKKQFQNRTVKKTYLALVQGRVKEVSGIISAPIGLQARSRRPGPARGVLRGSSKGALRGKIRDAVTTYKVRERLDGCTLLEVFPQTGRTHQVRVHLASIKHPVLGDVLYGPKGEATPSLPRQFLHALALELDLYAGGRLRLEADLPADLQKCLDHLRKGAGVC